MINKQIIILLFHETNNYKDSKEMYDNIIKKFENEFKDFYIKEKLYFLFFTFFNIFFK